MIIGLVIVSLILGLLCLINNAAANALFSLFVASNYLSWGTPIFCRLIWGEDRFRPGKFYTGRFSRPIAWIAVVYLLFGVILSMFPTGGPSPARKSIYPLITNSITNKLAANMNYTVVINGFVWIGCMVYYFLFARRWFTGPKMTVEERGSVSSQDPAQQESSFKEK